MYNNERCDYALMRDVAATAKTVGRELLRSMSDFKSGDKGKKMHFPQALRLGFNKGKKETPGCVYALSAQIFIIRRETKCQKQRKQQQK